MSSRKLANLIEARGSPRSNDFFEADRSWNALDNGNGRIVNEFRNIRAKCLNRRQLFRESSRRFSRSYSSSESYDDPSTSRNNRRNRRNRRNDSNSMSVDATMSASLSGSNSRSGSLSASLSASLSQNQNQNQSQSQSQNSNLTSISGIFGGNLNSRNQRRLYRAIKRNDSFILKHISCLYSNLYREIKRIELRLIERFGINSGVRQTRENTTRRSRTNNREIYEAHSRIVGLVMEALRMVNNKISFLNLADIIDSLKSRRRRHHYWRFSQEYKIPRNFPKRILRHAKKSIKFLSANVGNVVSTLFDSFSFVERIKALRFEMDIFGVKLGSIRMPDDIKSIFRRFRYRQLDSRRNDMTMDMSSYSSLNSNDFDRNSRRERRHRRNRRRQESETNSGDCSMSCGGTKKCGDRLWSSRLCRNGSCGNFSRVTTTQRPRFLSRRARGVARLYQLRN